MSSEIPVFPGEQSMTLLINYMGVSNLLYNKLIYSQNKGSDDVKIGDARNRITESQQDEWLLSIREIIAKSNNNEDFI